MPRTVTTTGGVCTIVAAVVVAAADDSLLTDDQIGAAAYYFCLPAAAAGQCTTADIAQQNAHAAAIPCDNDESTGTTDDDCPTSDVTTACEVCFLQAAQPNDPGNMSADEMATGAAVCAVSTETGVKASGVAGMVASLALASASAITTQL